MPVTASTVLRRGDVLWRHTADAVLVRRPDGDEVLKLTGSGIALWDALEGPVTFTQLCDDLALDHRADVETIRADIAPVIDDLHDRGVVRLD